MFVFCTFCHLGHILTSIGRVSSERGVVILVVESRFPVLALWEVIGLKCLKVLRCWLRLFVPLIFMLFKQLDTSDLVVTALITPLEVKLVQPGTYSCGNLYNFKCSTCIGYPCVNKKECTWADTSTFKGEVVLGCSGVSLDFKSYW